MIAGTWAKRLSLVFLGTAALTFGAANLSNAQTTTNPFDPPDPGQPIPNSGGLTFNGFVSATGGSGGSVAASSASNGSATVKPIPPATLFDFLGVSLSKPTGSSINFIQITSVLSTGSTRTDLIDVSSGSGRFSTTSSNRLVSSLTFTGFATSPAALSIVSRSSFGAPAGFSEPPLLLTSSFGYEGEGYGYEGEGYGYEGEGYGYEGEGYGYEGEGYGGEYGGEHKGGHHKKHHKKKKNIKVCGFKNCNDVFFIDDLETAAVPEPTTMLGLLVASGGLVALKRRRGQKQED